MSPEVKTLSHSPSPQLLLAALLVALAAGVTTASAAHAVGVPADTGTQVSWTVDGQAPPVAGRIPSSLVMTAPGFKLDRRAVAKRCAPSQATLDECPAESRIGSGLTTILVRLPGGQVDELPIETTLYHAPNDGVLAMAFLLGPRVLPGKLERTRDGIALTFDPMPSPPPIPQVSYELKNVWLDLGVSRKVTKRVGPKRRRTVSYSLVRTPAACPTGSWAASVALVFPDATSALLDTPMPCRMS